MVSCVGCEAGPWHSDCLEEGSTSAGNSYKCKDCSPGVVKLLAQEIEWAHCSMRQSDTKCFVKYIQRSQRTANGHDETQFFDASLSLLSHHLNSMSQSLLWWIM